MATDLDSVAGSGSVDTEPAAAPVPHHTQLIRTRILRPEFSPDEVNRLLRQAANHPMFHEGASGARCLRIPDPYCLVVVGPGIRRNHKAASRLASHLNMHGYTCDVAGDYATGVVVLVRVMVPLSAVPAPPQEASDDAP